VRKWIALAALAASLSLACSAHRPEILPPPQPKVNPETAKLVAEGDGFLRKNHLYGWRKAEECYQAASDLASDVEVQDKLALTRFLIISRELEEGIFAERHLNRLSALCSQPPSSRQSVLCQAAKTKLRFAHLLDQSPFGSPSPPLRPELSDEPELNRYAALLLTKDDDFNAYVRGVEAFQGDFPESLLTVYLDISDVNKGETARRLLALHPDFAELFFANGLHLLHSAAFQQGLAQIERGLALVPDHVPALVELGNSYVYALGMPEAALPLYARALEADRRSVRALFGKSVALHFLGEYVDSNMLLDQLLEPGRARWETVSSSERPYYLGQASYFKAYNLYRLAHPEESRLQVDRALQLQPNLEGAHYLSGVLFMDEHHLEAAQREFAVVIEGGTELCDAYYRMGQIRKSNGAARTIENFLNNAICLERRVRSLSEKLQAVDELDVDPVTREQVRAIREKNLGAQRSEALGSLDSMVRQVRNLNAIACEAFEHSMEELTRRIKEMPQ